MDNYTNNTNSSFGITTSDLFISSDERIKTNITVANLDDAISTIRLIEPKIYNYIDTVKKTSEPVWGFIAQEISNILPYAVYTKTEFIPNVFTPAEVTYSTNGTLISLTSGSTKFSNLIESTTIDLKLYYQNNDIQPSVTVKEKLNDNQILIDQILPVNISTVFVYGQKIDNFNVLKKDVIFSVAVSALKKLDEEIIAIKTFLQSKYPGEI